MRNFVKHFKLRVIRRHRMETQIKAFSKHLFWDVNRERLSLEKDDAYIIRQVLEYGKFQDWQLIKNHYGLKTITKKAMAIRSLEKKALSFISTLSGVPIKKFRCYTIQQSIPPHWNF